MKPFQRRVGIFILLALVFTSGLVSAQDNTVKVVGSGIVNPVFEALRTASGAAVSVESTTSGTRAGFEQLCGGLADVATATRAINADEAKNCTTNNVDYLELLVAHDIIAFITAPDPAVVQCVTTANLGAIFAPSSQGKITNWNQVNPAAADTPLTVIVPNDTLPSFATLDQLIEGDGVRTDALRQGSDTDVVTAVISTPGSVGAVSLSVATAAGASVKILQLDAGVGGGSTCVDPSAETVEQRLYTAANDLFIYTNRASLTKAGLQDVLNFAVGESAPGIVSGLGFTPPTAAVYDVNKTTLSGTGNTRPFSEASTSFSIPADVSGSVVIAGAAIAHDYLNTLNTSLTAVYSTITVDLKTIGQANGVRRLCNNELDLLAVTSPLTAEQEQNCQANNVSTFSIDLGKQAVVLVANAADTYLACLAPDQLATTWRATAADAAITMWNQVDPAFPAQPMTLFAPDSGHDETDLLLSIAAGTDVPLREDVAEKNNDALYRAAATANVPGALTYMTWADYQRVLANNQQRIQLVGIKNGESCVTPSEATIADGTYLFSRGVQLLVNNASITKVQVQSYLWFLASDDNYSVLEQAGFIGVSYGSLPALRQTLQTAYVNAAVTVSQPEATSEATAEVTTEAPVEATTEATVEATVETPAEPTVEATTEATTEATAEATTEATAEATPAS